jgi:predicted esterase
VWFVLHGFGQLAGFFIRHFAVLDDGTRLIVAPEALSRFYLGEVNGATSAQARVGATWMTREDRLTEIADYVRYLDSLHDHVRAMVGRDGVPCTALGFSQGVATACRWAARGQARLDRLVLWAGRLPPEFAERADVERLARLTLVRVLGARDALATASDVAEEERRLAALGLEATLLRFDGGHELDPATLRALAA